MKRDKSKVLQQLPFLMNNQCYTKSYEGIQNKRKRSNGAIADKEKSDTQKIKERYIPLRISL